jgi:hypothetical protein
MRMGYVFENAHVLPSKSMPAQSLSLAETLLRSVMAPLAAEARGQFAGDLLVPLAGELAFRHAGVGGANAENVRCVLFVGDA